MTTTKKELTREMLDHVIANCTAIDRKQRFRDMLDECYSFDAVGGPFSGMSPSRVLEEMEPITFRCGVNDYMDSEETIEIDGEDYDKREVDESSEEYIDGLRNELDAAEAEIEDDEEPDTSEVEALKEQIEACEKYQW